ncbi:MAG: UDP-N-acetyl-D-glucosamine dehydrogenase, partial [Candidatus Rokubacteria bacterium]|nr:UDP-N-acetyl-D-glucosamine dehydrogenase [Candidatus Rokubacteria bacterium]
MSRHSERLRQALEQHSARVGIIGLGYVGLPLAVAFGKAGFSVLGVDADRERVARLKAGESPVEDVGSDDLATLVASGRLTITTDASVLAGGDA